MLNGVRGNMAVVVNMRNNKHYVHRILTPDGSEFVFDVKRKDTEPTSGEPSSSDKRAPIGSASKKSIAQETDSVNTKNSLSEKHSDEACLAAVERDDMETAQRMVAEPTDREILAMALEGAVQSEEYARERRGRRSLRFLSYFNISKSVASSMTVTPSSLALVSLEPAASPATT